MTRARMGFRVITSRSIRAIVAGCVGCVLLTACGASSFDDLSSIAHGVPIPKGMVLVGQDQFTNGGFGHQKEVVLTYSWDHGCQALLAAWTQVLRRAGRDYKASGTISRYVTEIIEVHGGGSDITISLESGGPEAQCRQSNVAVEGN